MSIEGLSSSQSTRILSPEELVPEGLVAMATPEEALERFRMFNIKIGNLLLSEIVDERRLRDLDEQAEFWGDQLIVARKAYNKAS